MGEEGSHHETAVITLCKSGRGCHDTSLIHKRLDKTDIISLFFFKWRVLKLKIWVEAQGTLVSRERKVNGMRQLS